MEQTAVEWLENKVWELDNENFTVPNRLLEMINQAKEMEEKNLLKMLHKFGFDYTYNYRGEKTIYEWIPEWFKEYKRLEQFKNK